MELENGWAERKRAWVKDVNPYPFIKAVNIKHLPTRLKTSLFPKGRAGSAVGLPARIDENPAIRGHDLFFDKTCQ